MKKNMNGNDMEMWIEQFDFEALSADQKKVVLDEMSAEQYAQLRQTILASQNLFSEADNYQPKAFIPTSEATNFLLTPIPLYKALVGMAAAVLLMLLAFPIKKMVLNQQQVKYVTVFDTIETEKYVYDTVERIIEKPVVQEKIVYVNQPVNIASVQDSRRLLDVPVAPVYLSFSPSVLQNKGTSLKDDTVKFDLPTIY
jgi:hypothetical protein